MAIDASGLIPTSQSTELITNAVQQSAALTLGRRVPMPAGITQIPVLSALPSAEFVGVAGRKPYTDIGLENKVLRPEEIACVVAVAQQYLDDSALNLWNAVRPELASAIARGIDAAIFGGVGAPSSFPTGGIIGGLTPATGTDVVDTINNAMGDVEASGLPVTGHAAAIPVRAALRGVRTNTGEFLLGDTQFGGQAGANIFGLPVSWHTGRELAPGINFVTGHWPSLIVGVRQDIRYETSSDGVIADASGKVILSAFQQDMVLMRVYMRVGIVVAAPMQPDGSAAVPFAVANIERPTSGGGGLQVQATPTNGGAAKKTAAAQTTSATTP